MKRPILWASLPTAVAAIGQLGERAAVYYCGDDFSALDGVDHAAVAKLEKELAFRADLIIAASEPLAARFPSHKTLYVPHGVDFELFSKPAPRAPDLPMGRPIAGYYGSIADWLDLDAVAAAARQLPDWDFVFIGAVKTSVSEIAKLPNVKFLGPRPHAALPSYVQHWTASLVPFRNTAQIQACNPLKLREYLAAGRPIACTTGFPALAPYADRLTIASSPALLAPAIVEASRSLESAAIRQAAVSGESWAARAKLIAQALEKL
jgi:glycosyltransferase involved in cell wall biosynthesis